MSPTSGPGMGPTSAGGGVSSGGLEVASGRYMKIMRGVPLEIFPAKSSAKKVRVVVPSGREKSASIHAPSVSDVVDAFVMISRMIRFGSAAPRKMSVVVANVDVPAPGSRIVGGSTDGTVVVAVVDAVVVPASTI